MILNKNYLNHKSLS